MCKFCTLLNTIQSLLRESVRLSSAKYWREQLTTDVIFNVNPQMLTAMYRIGLQHRVTTVEIPKHFPQPFTGLLPPSGTTWVGWYQKKHSPTHTHPDQTSFINFLHLLRSIASSLFNLHTWQSFSTTSVQVLFGLPHVLEPPTSYSIHFFTQSLSSFRNTRPYHCKLFC